MDGMRKGILGLAAIGMSAALSAAGDTEPPPLAAYDGKYPHAAAPVPQFLDHPLVRRAVETVVEDADLRRRLLDHGGPKTPIWIEDGRIHSWGCEQHLCGPHNWTVSMKLDGSEPEVCHHNADTPASGATWYLAGRTEVREFQCPSEKAEGD